MSDMAGYKRLVAMLLLGTPDRQRLEVRIRSASTGVAMLALQLRI